MDGVFGLHNWDVEFDLYDGEIDSDEALLYRYGNRRLAGLTAAPGTLVYRTVLRHGGHPWLLIVTPAPSFFSSADRYQPWLIAEGGVAVSLMFAVGLWSLLTVRRRAIVLAERMSSAFRAKDAQTRVMVDSITDHAIFTLDVRRRVTSWNAGCERMLGFTAAEIVGQPVSALSLEADDEEDSARIEDAPGRPLLPRGVARPKAGRSNLVRAGDRAAPGRIDERARLRRHPQRRHRASPGDGGPRTRHRPNSSSAPWSWAGSIGSPSDASCA